MTENMEKHTRYPLKSNILCNFNSINYKKTKNNTGVICLSIIAYLSYTSVALEPCAL